MEITKKDQKEFFFVVEFFRVFRCIPWLKNISFDTLSQYFKKISACSASSARNLFEVKSDRERLQMIEKRYP